jgi:hypothetical protein
VHQQKRAGSALRSTHGKYGLLGVFSVGVDRLIERAGKASGRDGLKGRCAGNDFVAAAEVGIKVLADGSLHEEKKRNCGVISGDE